MDLAREMDCNSFVVVVLYYSAFMLSCHWFTQSTINTSMHGLIIKCVSELKNPSETSQVIAKSKQILSFYIYPII